MTRRAPPPEVRAPSSSYPELDGGMWLARRLGLHGVLVQAEIFAGVTDAPERARRLKEQLRRAIVERGLGPVICGRGPDRKSDTYQSAFERLYGEQLRSPNARGENQHA
jgi:hypothetical protein